MTREQIEWAKQHDWYRCHLPCGTVIVRGDVDEPTDITFTDYNKLRAWAGY